MTNKRARFVFGAGGVNAAEGFLLRARNKGPRFGRGAIDGSRLTTMVNETALVGEDKKGLSR